MVTIDENHKIPKSGKTKRKRSCKRKNKNLKIMIGSGDGQDEQMFNEGDGLLDSDYEAEQNQGDEMDIHSSSINLD
jgi:hypothetical protein